MVIDANILFALLIRKGITERVLFSNDLRLYAPEYLFIEFKKHEQDVLSLTNRAKQDFLNLIGLLSRRIELIPVNEFKHCFIEAESLLEDKDDAAYLAVCLAKKMPLWSNDNHFKKQDKVRVYTTQDLLHLFLHGEL